MLDDSRCIEMNHKAALASDKAEFVMAVLSAESPPWRPIPSRQLAKMMGVSLQVLANWRVRDSGPPVAPQKKGRGNRTFYRPDEAACWAVNSKVAAWEICRNWMARRGVEVAGESSAESTAFLMNAVDSMV